MYKVFLNEHELIFAVDTDDVQCSSSVREVRLDAAAAFFYFLSDIESDVAGATVVLFLMSEAVFREVMSNLTLLKAAGGLVTDQQGRLLCIKRYGRWDLPKGLIEENETASAAALREVCEESGLRVPEVTSLLAVTRHLYRSPYIDAGNNWVLKETVWYEMRYAGNGDVTPQTEEGIEEAAWLNEEQLTLAYATMYAGLRELIDNWCGGVTK